MRSSPGAGSRKQIKVASHDNAGSARVNDDAPRVSSAVDLAVLSA